uniref:Ig-like domain-containing protein n=1 Tax=Knipowitschia caucasica TaxID=637954 RepID=A0AAV2JDI5_KNICA
MWLCSKWTLLIVSQQQQLFTVGWTHSEQEVKDTVGVQRPALTVLPPSREELLRDSVTLLCVASGGFPSDWTLSWRVGGASTEGSHSPGVLRGDSLYDRISVLQLSTEHWRDASVMCEAHRSGQSPVTQGLEAASCSQVEPVKQQQASVQMRMEQSRAMDFVSLWNTFGGGTQLIVDLGVQRPALTVLPPSREEMLRDSVTLLCVASGGFPSDWTLSWRVGGASTEGSHSPGVLRGDSLYDRISVLQLSTEHWRDASVMCEAHRSGQSPVTQGLEAASCSQ